MTGDPTADASAQAEVIAFLSDPAAHVSRPSRVERIETHGALVFLAGDEALKIKRAVKLAYLDFSTLARREAVCRREIEVNRPNAGDIYRGVVAITRESEGRLAIGGRGEPVEWAVRMARFGQEALLSHVAEHGGIGASLATELAATLSLAHAGAEPFLVDDAVDRIRRVVHSVGASLAASAATASDIDQRRQRFLALAGKRLEMAGDVLERRAAAGRVRRCHGDAHLGNIVLWQGRPVLFDAIEFDEALATVDVLYDLAFLLMDLDRRGQRRAAQIVLDRYLAASVYESDLEGLVALPLFLGLRAAIRAMVALDRSRVEPDDRRHATEQHARDTLDLALGYLEPAAPRLVAVGGLSGTGKTTVAAHLAPLLLPAPGALHLRSDTLRKRLAGVGELDRLPAATYTPAASARVYAALARRAGLALAAGHSVVVDAVFARPEDRAPLEQVAAAAQVRLEGLWLEADPAALRARVAARSGDASDATPDVVDRQLALAANAPDWQRLLAGGDRDTVLAAAARMLGLDPGEDA